MTDQVVAVVDAGAEKGSPIPKPQDKPAPTCRKSILADFDISEQPTEERMLSYSDMVTLLLTMFIALLLNADFTKTVRGGDAGGGGGPGALHGATRPGDGGGENGVDGTGQAGEGHGPGDGGGRNLPYRGQASTAPDAASAASTATTVQVPAECAAPCRSGSTSTSSRPIPTKMAL